MTITITLICIFLYRLLSIFLHFVYMFDLSLIIFWAKQGSFYRVSTLSCFSHVRLFVTLCTVAHQASLFMGFPRQKYWRESLCPPPGDLPNTGIKPVSPALAGRFFTTESPETLHTQVFKSIIINKKLEVRGTRAKWASRKASRRDMVSTLILVR